MKRTIGFYFDYVSPYAYLASTQIRAIAERNGAEVEAVPVLFAAMLASTGSRGPAEIPVRRDYMVRDVIRLARFLEVPIAPPATHPFNPLAALRFTHAVEDAADRWRLIDGLFRAAWVEGRRIDDPRFVAAIATDQGFDADALAARATSDEVKTKLRGVTDEAIARGAFGVPTMIVEGELFWGVDSLHLLERYLTSQDLPDLTELSRWRAIEPSAVRRVVG